jgi:fructokinase
MLGTLDTKPTLVPIGRASSVAPVIVVAGEALIDLVGEPDGRYRALPGGSPANVAVGLARLGHRTELLARLAEGRFGRIIRDHLLTNGVGLAHAVDTGDPATLAVATQDAAAGVTYDFYLDGTADWGWEPAELPDPLPATARALCTGSLAMAIEPAASVLTDLIVREHGRGQVTIVLDPNVRPAVLGSPGAARDRLANQLACVDVVKVSDEDVAWLAGGQPIEAVAAEWIEAGPALVVVTLGSTGAYARTRTGIETRVPATPVAVADTIGAGDAFTAALVDGLHRHDLLGRASDNGSPTASEVRSSDDRARDRLGALDRVTLDRVLGHAAAAAALTCSRPGADPPTAAELSAFHRNQAAPLRVGEPRRHT